MYIDDRMKAAIAELFSCDVVVVQDVIDSIEETRRQMREKLEKAAEAMADMAAAAADADQAEEIVLYYPLDFSCICPVGISRHLLAWYTSGFE